MSEDKTPKNPQIPSQGPKQPQTTPTKEINERGSTVPEYKTPVRPPKE
jgi:hypothetical protein